MRVLGSRFLATWHMSDGAPVTLFLFLSLIIVRTSGERGVCRIGPLASVLTVIAFWPAVLRRYDSWDIGVQPGSNFILQLSPTRWCRSY